MNFLNFEERLLEYNRIHSYFHDPKAKYVILKILLHLLSTFFSHWGVFLISMMVPCIYIFDLVPIHPVFFLCLCHLGYYLLLEPVLGTVFAPFLFAVAYLTFYMQSCCLAYNNGWCLLYAGWLLHITSILILRLLKTFSNTKRSIYELYYKNFYFGPLFICLQVVFYFGYRLTLKDRLKAEFTEKGK